jgi:hypothetical protein
MNRVVLGTSGMKQILINLIVRLIMVVVLVGHWVNMERISASVVTGQVLSCLVMKVELQLLQIRVLNHIIVFNMEWASRSDLERVCLHSVKRETTSQIRFLVL